MSNNKIRDLENRIFELMQELQKLQKENVKQEVKNYDFSTLNGKSNLLDFFEDKDNLLVSIIWGKVVDIAHYGVMV